MILGREQARLQEELELVRRQVSQVAHVMQVTHFPNYDHATRLCVHLATKRQLQACA